MILTLRATALLLKLLFGYLSKQMKTSSNEENNLVTRNEVFDQTLTRDLSQCGKLHATSNEVEREPKFKTTGDKPQVCLTQPKFSEYEFILRDKICLNANFALQLAYHKLSSKFWSLPKMNKTKIIRKTQKIPGIPELLLFAEIQRNFNCYNLTNITWCLFHLKWRNYGNTVLQCRINQALGP